MPLWVVNLVFAAFIIATFVAGIWLLLNLDAVARLFAGSGAKGEMVPAPGVRRVSRGKVWLMLAIFNIGWIASVAIWAFAIDSDVTSQVVDAEA